VGGHPGGIVGVGRYEEHQPVYPVRGGQRPVPGEFRAVPDAPVAGVRLDDGADRPGVAPADSGEQTTSVDVDALPG
jgi:hypothetical protein